MRPHPMLNDRLQQLRYRLLLAWRWWCKEIQPLCPAWIKKLLGQSTQNSLLLQDEQGLQWLHPPGLHQGARLALNASAHQQTAFIRQLPSQNITLLLPEHQLLRVPLQLADEALPHLDRVLSHQLPLLTPFQQDQVYTAPIKLGRTEGKTELELVVVPRQALEATLALLAAMHLNVTQVRPFSDANRHECNLLPDTPTPRSLPGQLTRLLVPINLILLAILIGRPLWQQQQQIHDLQTHRNQLRQQAETVYQERQALAQLQQIHQQLQLQQQQANHSLQLLTTLSQQLPDTAWLDQLEWTARTLHLKGEADDAAGLISVLDRVPAFHHVHFSSPVIRNPKSSKERFSIEINLEHTP